ncbi:Uncharacterised protein [Acinetobacter baumannii]|nr:Uncharacterised protein [Acinetobacter baumannii]
MIEGAQNGLFDPQSIKPAAVIRLIPGRTKAAGGKRLSRRTTQCGDIGFGRETYRLYAVIKFKQRSVIKRQNQIDLALNQAEAQIGQAIRQGQLLCGDFSLHQGISRQVGLSQNRG